MTFNTLTSDIGDLAVLAGGGGDGKDKKLADMLLYAALINALVKIMNAYGDDLTKKAQESAEQTDGQIALSQADASNQAGATQGQLANAQSAQNGASAAAKLQSSALTR